jgi:hypothetical protein
MFPRRNTRRLSRRKVSDDWVRPLPQEKSQVFEIVIHRWECTYAMMSVALDDALSLRASGEVVCARQQVSIAADLLGRLTPSLVSVCSTLSARGRRLGKFPIVEPLNAGFFRGDTAQSAASWNGILHHILFGVRPRFFHKLRILSRAIQQLEREFLEARDDVVRGMSIHAGDAWERLDNLHYDFNTCLREIEVVLKSFLRVLPDEQLPALAAELDAPTTSMPVRVKTRLSGASASA